MTTKRYPWKPEYATNSELFWHDLRENERKYAEEHTKLIEEKQIIEESIEEPIELEQEDKRKRMLAFLGVD